MVASKTRVRSRIVRRMAGSGYPAWFQCSNCRKHASFLSSYSDRSWYHQLRVMGIVRDVELTGRTRVVDDDHEHARLSKITREYECRACGFLGWSRHVDLGAKQREAEGKNQIRPRQRSRIANHVM